MVTKNELSIGKIEADIDRNVRSLARNPFPVESLPMLIQEIIRETNTTLNFPVDFTAMGVLFAASLGIGNTYKIQLKQGHSTNAILWCSIVGSSGIMKTPPLNFTLRPIFERDKENVKRYNQDKIAYENFMQLDRKEKKALGVQMGKPVYTKFLLSDYTLESLSELHNNNLRGVGVYKDELAGWVRNFSRYNGGSEVEAWLQMWNGDLLIVDRKAGDKVYINESFVSVIGGIQPELLDELSAKGGDANGFLARILFAFPEGLQRQAWNDSDLDLKFTNRYKSVIEKLLDLTYLDENETLTFEATAKKIIMQWQADLTDRINESPEPLKVSLNKLDTYCLRLCLIVQLLRWACNEADKKSIDVHSTQAAIKLTEYFMSNAMRVHSYLKNTPVDRLPETTRTWYDQLPERFNTSQAKELAEKLKLPGLSQRNVANLLERTDLFKKIHYGSYAKLF